MNGRIIREKKTERLPIVGKIKIGKKTEKGFPESLDYFIADGKYSGLFDAEYPNNPKNVEICFLSDNIEDVCFERYEIRKGMKLFAYGDGYNFFVWDDKEIDNITGQAGTYRKITLDDDPDIKAKVEKLTGETWDEVLTMRFLIPKIKGILGVWQLQTKGAQSSIPQIIGAFDSIQKIAGTVKNLVFDLSVKKVKDQKPNSKALFPVLQLVPNLSLSKLDEVRSIVENGIEIRGLLTEEKIDQVIEIVEPKVIPEPNSVMRDREAEKEALHTKIRNKIDAMPSLVKEYFTDQNMTLEQQYNFCKERKGNIDDICADIQAINVSKQFKMNETWDNLPMKEESGS